jgi:hypothetical protein
MACHIAEVRDKQKGTPEMTINVTFYSSPVIEVFRQGFKALPMSNVVPGKNMLCSNLQEVQEHLAAYVEEVRATGKPAVVGFYKAHRQGPGARKPAGFDALGRKHTPRGSVHPRRRRKPSND